MVKVKKVTKTKTFGKAFLDEINKNKPVVKAEHVDRSCRATYLLIEYARQQFMNHEDPKSQEKLGEYIRRLLAMELIENPKLIKALKQEEEKLIREARLHCIEDRLSLHAMEVALVLKASIFKKIREQAGALMILCTSSTVRAK